MIDNGIFKRVIVAAFAIAMCTDAGIAYAFDMCKNMFDMMNQSKLKQSEWTGSYRDRDDYYGDPQGGSGYGYGPPGYGYGPPPVPSYRYTVPAYAAPQPGNDALQAEIYQLKLRIRSLEKALIHQSSQQHSVPTNPGTS